MSTDFYQTRHSSPNRVTVKGSFVGGTEEATKATGRGFTVAWVSTGKYRITLDEKYFALEHAGFSMQATTPGNVKAYAWVFTALASNQTVDVYLYESGTLTDIAALEWVHFELTLVKTSAED